MLYAQRTIAQRQFNTNGHIEQFILGKMMRKKKFRFNFNAVEKALKKTNSPFDAALTHGLICGMLCTVTFAADDLWQTIVIGPLENKASLAVLQTLLNSSYQSLHDFSFDFALLLPDDSTPVSQRIEAISSWCNGFMTGLQKNPPNANALSADATEALADLTHIAQLDPVTDLGQEEAHEAAYLELTEYVRLAVIMIYHELRQHKRRFHTLTNHSFDSST